MELRLPKREPANQRDRQQLVLERPAQPAPGYEVYLNPYWCHGDPYACPYRSGQNGPTGGWGTCP